jgi:hypothetical protein
MEVAIMARRDKNTPDEATPAESTEAPASTEAKAPEKPVDLTAFEAAVTTAVGTKADDGSLTEESVQPVQAAYRELDGTKARNAAKNRMTELMRDAMNANDIFLAKAYMALSDQLTAAKASSEPKAPADPTEAYVQRATILGLATALVESTAGEGVDVTAAQVNVEKNVGEATGSAQAYLAWVNGDEATRGDEPEATPVVKAAVKLAQGKAARVGTGRSGGTFDGPRRDIGKHITSAFSGVESGAFLTVAQIRSAKSDEYGDNPPSAGAISARLFPSSGNCTVEGITPGMKDGIRGATKA